jgi:hypothetical protein
VAALARFEVTSQKSGTMEVGVRSGGSRERPLSGTRSDVGGQLFHVLNAGFGGEYRGSAELCPRRSNRLRRIEGVPRRRCAVENHGLPLSL